MKMKDKIMRVLLQQERELFKFCYEEKISQEELDGEEESNEEVAYVRGRLIELRIIRRRLEAIFNEKSSKQNGK